MTYSQRGLLAAVLMLVGLVFWPLLVLGALIAWSVYSDIRDEPERKKREAEIQILLNKPVAVEDMRATCESPAEEAFFDAMVSAYGLTAGPGCIAGGGIRLRTQVGLGQLRIGRNSAWDQFRGDFLIDDKLVVEIDGAAWHGSPEAVAKDAARDEVIRAEGYTVLRIPAKVVFDTPAEAVRRVEEARRQLTRSVVAAGKPAAQDIGAFVLQQESKPDFYDQILVDAASERAAFQAKHERRLNDPVLGQYYKASYDRLSPLIPKMKADREARDAKRRGGK